MIKQTKYGWVDLSNLTTKGHGLYDWEASVGATVPFEYCGIQNVITIKKKISAQYVLIDIPNYVENRKIYVGQIKNNQLGACLNFVVSEFRYDTGDIIGNIKILDRYIEYPKNNKGGKHKYYHCKCLIDNYEWNLREDHLQNGVKCPVCNGNVAMRGVNDFATITPHLVKYFDNIEDAYNNCANSNKKFLLKCPRCGKTKYQALNNLQKNGFSCTYCSDGISYPNKFVRNFLSQILSIDSIKNEYVFEWSKSVPVSWNPNGKKMIYDIYLPEFNIIIENQGAQHYRNTAFSKKVSLEQIQENDQAKRRVAIENGILSSNYIELDCAISDKDYIKNSIMNSPLPSLLKFTINDIDWDKCDRYASGSVLIDTCDLWNSGIKSKTQIGNIMGLHPSTIDRYLKKAKTLNLLTA